ncbi:HNH endonuclease family protein [Nocardioides sp. NPDC127503]|uniref:HNH endonuclease family protein n=1 Tax=unclassified Nocardioides TaxID=2615069 RepID=UPI0027CC6D33|nr:HNH endonuclease family protein [Actinomycetota bacterium]
MKLRGLFILACGALVPLTIPAAAHAESYSQPLSTAIGDLSVATENRTGYSRDLFQHWIDADGDGCSTRNEVLIAEAEEAPTVGSSCSLSGGRWYSYYDGLSWTATSDIDIDHMVPLAEAWDSGARTWTSTERKNYANDLGYYGSLVGVTDNENQEKSDADPAEWMPDLQKCRYLKEYVSVKIRWRLSVDSTEKSALTNLTSANGCGSQSVSVTLAR